MLILEKSDIRDKANELLEESDIRDKECITHDLVDYVIDKYNSDLPDDLYHIHIRCMQVLQEEYDKGC